MPATFTEVVRSRYDKHVDRAVVARDELHVAGLGSLEDGALRGTNDARLAARATDDAEPWFRGNRGADDLQIVVVTAGEKQGRRIPSKGRAQLILEVAEGQRIQALQHGYRPSQQPAQANGLPEWDDATVCASTLPGVMRGDQQFAATQVGHLTIELAQEAELLLVIGFQQPPGSIDQ